MGCIIDPSFQNSITNFQQDIISNVVYHVLILLVGTLYIVICQFTILLLFCSARCRNRSFLPGNGHIHIGKAAQEGKYKGFLSVHQRSCRSELDSKNANSCFLLCCQRLGFRSILKLKVVHMFVDCHIQNMVFHWEVVVCFHSLKYM